jgi:hypothetical protein
VFELLAGRGMQRHRGGPLREHHELRALFLGGPRVYLDRQRVRVRLSPRLVQFLHIIRGLFVGRRLRVG